MWPSFRLTRTEANYNNKYYDPRPGKTKAPVFRRFYGGALELGPSKRRDTFIFQISRRARVMGLTASGDLSQFLVTAKDVAGEQYISDPTPLAALLGGYNMLPLSQFYGVPEPDQQTLGATVLSAYIFEPNILLPPNNTLTIEATPAGPAIENVTFRVDLTLHVYEFPGMPGSPL